MYHNATLSISLLAMMAVSANAATLSTGTGDGSLTVDVDLYGSFGDAVSFDGSGDAVYDPIGSIGASGTVYESFLYVPSSGARAALSAVAGAATIISQSGTQVVSQFRYNALDIVLTQSVSESFNGAERVGTALTQSYAITNTDVLNSFDFVRYVDGDLQFDDSISDGGGLTQVGANRILFETDAGQGGGAPDASTTFLGVTTNVTGNASTSPQRYQIAPFAELRSRIGAGEDLDNTIQGDNDGDGFIEGAYDVTLAFQNSIQLAPNGRATYTTSTLFGNAVPSAPGSSEALPLLPTDLGPDGGFEFDIPASSIVDGQTIFIDPEIATGYTYTVTGAEFDSVTAPSLGSVSDPDGYLLSYDSIVDMMLAPGQTLIFDSALDITSFTLRGIDPNLALDPTDTTAFVTGIALRDVTADSVLVRQVPIITDTDPVDPLPPVPLPAGIWLMGTVLAGLGGLGRLARNRRVAA